MNLRIRRSLVLGGVVASLVIGVVSIRMAAQLAAAAAPPPVPPISISELQEQLRAEQARAAALQLELEELTGLSGSLASALDTTGDQVTADGLSAKQLRERLAAAEARLAKVTSLLKQAAARLAALQQAASNAGSGGSAGGSEGGGTTPTPRPVVMARSLTLTVSGGAVRADWETCTYSGFTGYAVVRSIDKEVHWPPESGETEVARIGSRTTTAATDDAAPSGTSWYRVYCLYTHDGETKVAGKSDARQITVP